ncbi:hypothetical protein [Rhizobium sp. 'Codium 1']|uniref:hypothetical protein n=1 Tax=Rhizobium sp. 'Codium 1' TaxID=2940484 RepID=UPI001E500F8E|nr:hypothetical protein [Rhizobium sp. 'Codium 1']MCC8934894.1 hypothetical protein [Rhizobium sp. 'Codium 1']
MTIDMSLNAAQSRTLAEVELLVLRNVEASASPPTEFEAATLAEVMALPRVLVTRPPEDQLLKIGMRRNECHANCAMQATNDTEGRSRHVTGWYVSASSLVLHSVAEIEGQWFCLTPQIVRGPDQFEFVPDEAIEWRDAINGMSREPYRKGERLPETLRRYPDLEVQMSHVFRSLVASGMSIIAARDMVDVTFKQKLLDEQALQVDAVL